MTVTELPMAMQTGTVYQATEQIQVTATTTKSHTQHKLVITTGGHESSLVKVIHMGVASHSQAHDPFHESGQSHTDLWPISWEWPVTLRLMTPFMRVASHSDLWPISWEWTVTHWLYGPFHEWPVTHRLMTCFMRVATHRFMTHFIRLRVASCSWMYDPFHESGQMQTDLWSISWGAQMLTDLWSISWGAQSLNNSWPI